MIRKRKIAQIIFVAAICLIFNQVAVLTASPKRGGILNFADWPTLSLDIHKEKVLASSVSLSNIHNSLLTYDRNGKIIPELAQSWTVSKNEKVYTFSLNNNVYFHNGRKMTSEDVKYSIERILNPDVGSSRYDTLMS
jgi:peptide/nickel transport system substrate-binding protein